MKHSQTASILLILSTTIEGATLTSLSLQPNLTSGSVDLSALGTTSWAAWDSRSPDEFDSILPTALKTGGTGVFSGISGTDGSDVRSTENTGIFPDNLDFTWSDSTTPPPVGGVLSGVSTILFETTGVGVSFTLTSLPTLSAGQTYLIHVFATSYRGTSTLNLSNGINPTLTLSGAGKTGTSNIDWFQFEYNPDSASDVLTISNILTVNGGGTASSRSMLLGAAVGVIPEPSFFLLSALGGFAAAFRRRVA